MKRIATAGLLLALVLGLSPFTVSAVSRISVVPNTTSAVVSWTSNNPEASIVRYGTNPGSMFLSASLADFTTAHSVTLSNLSSATTYYFHIVESQNDNASLYSSFRTLGGTNDAASLQERLTQLQTQLQVLQNQTAGATTAAIARTLKLGDRGEDVRALQKLLNSDPGTRIASSGSGSPGNETTYFGPATRAAVIKYQNMRKNEVLTPAGLTQGTGIVGALTRAALQGSVTPSASAIAYTPTQPAEPVVPVVPVTAGLAKFFAEDRVETLVAAEVKAAISDAGSLGSQSAGAVGSIVGGPASGVTATYWQVDFDEGVDGWVLESSLTGTIAGTNSDFTAAALAAARIKPGSPPTPTDLSASALSSSQVKLSWADVTGEDKYAIQASLKYANGYSAVGTATANITTYTASNLTPNTTYYFRIKAVNTIGSSAYSNPVSAKTLAATPPPPVAPVAPTGLSASAISASQINTTWNSVSDATSYKLERGNGSTFSQIATISATSYSDTNLAASTNYSYRVRASNSTGDSPYSATISATTQTAPVVSTKFISGDRIQTTAIVNVRDAANGNVLGTQNTGAAGTVIGGPISAGGYVWWNINYDLGVDGWSIEDYLVKSVPPVTYVITANAGTGGTITPSGSITVSSGSSQAFTVSANSGYQISAVTVDGVSQGALSTYTFSNVTSNHSITASFSQTTATPPPPPPPTSAGSCTTITQYGITWTFDKAYPCGTFITGDWWVIGPVVVQNVNPGWNGQMNGAMLNPDPGVRTPYPGEKQGYDARAYGTFSDDLRVKFPVTLQPDDSLVSVKSANPSYGSGRSFIDEAAFLTVLSAAPYTDQFPLSYYYSPTAKQVFRLSQVDRSKLPGLSLPAGATFDAAQAAERIRGPRLGHLFEYSYQYISPAHLSGNDPGGVVYSRDKALRISDAMLGVMLANPNEQLLTNILWEGIQNYTEFKRAPDLRPANGGHSNGNKGPIVLAGLLFNNTDMISVAQSMLSNEDGQPYMYDDPRLPAGERGKVGWTGAKVLWTENFNATERYETLPPSQWTTDTDGSLSMTRQESYRQCCGAAGQVVGEALAIRLMNGMSAWGNDTFFKYIDRRMREVLTAQQLDLLHLRNTGWGSTAGDTGGSDFALRMWNTYRGPIAEYPVTPPSTPGSFTANAVSRNQINLSWTSGANAGGYVLERSLSSSSGFSVIASPEAAAISYQDTGLSPATTYYYKIKSKNTDGESAYVTTSATTNANPSNGQLGYWPLNSNVNDESGIGNNGETNGSFSIGRFSQGVTLNGSQYVYVGFPTLASLGITNQMSVSAWVNQTNNTGGQAIFARGGWAGSEGETSIVVWLDGGVPWARIGNGGSSIYLGGESAAIGSGWHHIVLTLDTTAVKIYVDGSLVSQRGTASFGNLNDVAAAGTSIGTVRNWWRNNLPFIGSIDEVRLFNRAITTTEIQNLYNNNAIARAAAPVPGSPSSQSYLANTLEQMINAASELVNLLRGSH